MSSRSINITQIFQSALKHHQAGRLQQAEGFYRQILKVDSNNPYANHFLGVIAYQFGRIETAIKLISKSIKAKPDYAEAYNNLGIAVFDLGDFNKAVNCYQKAIANNPEYAEAYNNLGNAFKKQGKMNEAMVNYQKALAIRKDFAQAYYNLGDLQYDQGLMGEAIDYYQKALAIRPDYAEALNNLGNAFLGSGNVMESESCYQKALAIRPDYAEALNNLGTLLEKKNELHSAAMSYKKALTIAPDYAEAYYNLAHVQDDQGKMGEAEKNYLKAISINPEYGESHNNLGTLYKKQGFLSKAVACFRKAISINPNYAEAYNNLGNALLEVGILDETENIFRKAIDINPEYPEATNNLDFSLQQQGNISKAPENFEKGISLKTDFSEAHLNLGNALPDSGLLDDAVASYRKALSLKPDYENAHSNLLYSYNYFADICQEEIYRESLAWDRQHAKELLPTEPVYANIKEPDRRLRIGYVSPDFRTHSVAYFFEPFLRAHNRERVEIFCYANVKKTDDVTQRLQEEADHWSSIVGKTDDVVAEQIRNDKIDVLVDLAGHTANNRLLIFAHKPAPVQVTWLGYPNTTGMSVIDYRFVDGVTDPVGKADDLHSEELVRLPNGFCCFQPTVDAPEVGDAPMGKNGFVTFGSVNTLAKLNKEVLGLWVEILHKIADSHLLIFGKAFAEESGRDRFLDFFSVNDIEADRIELIPPVPHSEFLSIHSRIDIILDPFPYNGQTSTCHSLWMGVPLITLRGENHVARVGASILTHIGLADLIAENKEEYLNKAIKLAENPDYLSFLRGGMRARMLNSHICDAKGFAKTVEEAYRNMWEKYSL